VSGSGGADIVHGAGVPTPKWWRPFRGVPLIVLAIASLVAALVGWTAQARLDADAAVIAPVTPTEAPAASAVRDACAPALPVPASEPWVGDAAAASQQVWDEHSADLAGPVVTGVDGWAFYNDQIEENFSQSAGRRLLTVSEVTAWHDYFASVASALEEQGIQFYIEVTPSVSSVYPEKLPTWASELRGSTALDQFIAASPDLPIVDFRADLRKAAESDAVFTPVNTHWTDWGGYVGWQTFARCHDAAYPEDAPIHVPAVDGVVDAGVFNEYASYGIPDAEPQWTKPVYAEQLAPVRMMDNTTNMHTLDGGTPIDLPSLPATTQTDNSWSDGSALILRDSMGSALSGLWAQEYAKTWQIQHRYDDWSNPPNFASLVTQYQPDVVIVQLAERHLVNAPASTITTGY